MSDVFSAPSVRCATSKFRRIVQTQSGRSWPSEMRRPRQREKSLRRGNAGRTKHPSCRQLPPRSCAFCREQRRPHCQRNGCAGLLGGHTTHCRERAPLVLTPARSICIVFSFPKQPLLRVPRHRVGADVRTRWQTPGHFPKRLLGTPFSDAWQGSSRHAATALLFHRHSPQHGRP